MFKKYSQLLFLLALTGCASVKPYLAAGEVGLATALGGEKAGLLTLASLFVLNHPYITGFLLVLAGAAFFAYRYITRKKG